MAAFRRTPIRLLYVINGLGPGGAERSLAELLPVYLANDIAPVIVCLRRRDKGVESSVRELGCPVRFIPPGGLINRVRAIRRIIGEEQPSLVHTTLFESDIAGRLAAIGSGVPVLTSLVNTSYDPVRNRDPNIRRGRLLLTRLADGWTARHLTTHFHAITHAVKADAVDGLGIPPERVTVVERGREAQRLGSIDPTRRAAARRRLDIPDDAEVIVNVGRQEFQKGQKFLLQAAADLIRTRPRLMVVISGREGHASAELMALCARLQLGDRVRFLGHRDDVAEVLAAADVFAFPSVYEGLGGSVIEAMALGLPIVASSIAALREVVEDGGNGILVEPESPTALASGLARVLDDRDLAIAFATRGREIFRERFAIERSARRMIELYRRIATVGDGAGQVCLEPHSGGAHV